MNPMPAISRSGANLRGFLIITAGVAGAAMVDDNIRAFLGPLGMSCIGLYITFASAYRGWLDSSSGEVRQSEATTTSHSTTKTVSTSTAETPEPEDAAPVDVRIGQP